MPVLSVPLLLLGRVIVVSVDMPLQGKGIAELAAAYVAVGHLDFLYDQVVEGAALEAYEPAVSKFSGRNVRVVGVYGEESTRSSSHSFLYR